MRLAKNRIVCSHGIGNQFFQFVFAHFLNKSSSGQVLFENNPVFSKGICYMLSDMRKVCGHIRYRRNVTISHKNLFGKIIMRLGLINIASSIIMRNFFVKRINLYGENDIFNFNIPEKNLDPKTKQYYGFFLNWRYAESEKHGAVQDILNLIDIKSKDFKIEKPTGKTLVVHVRRGDYLERGNDQILGVIDPKSYKRVIESIMKQNLTLRVFTLTDDDNLSLNLAYGPIFGKILTRNEVNEWQALKMMIEADYVIAANSTFSWWGAVLSYVKNRSTCYIPEQFYKNLDDKGSFLFPGLNTFENRHL
jgi:hypothetical protein